MVSVCVCVCARVIDKSVEYIDHRMIKKIPLGMRANVLEEDGASNTVCCVGNRVSKVVDLYVWMFIWCVSECVHSSASSNA